jgi:hypothetical protein
VAPAAVAAAALALFAQLPALHVPFFADDFLFLDQVRDRSLFTVLAEPDPIGNYYRPVGRQLYFWSLRRLAGENPVLHHAANLALFAAVVVLLVMLGAARSGPAVGFLAGALVAIHYAPDATTRWISGAQDLLATLAALGSLWLWQRGRPWLAAAALFLGLLSKETVAATPLVALALGTADAGVRPAARRTWPLFLAAVAWGVLWLAAPGGRAALAAPTEELWRGLVASPPQCLRVFLGAEWEPADPATLWSLADWRIALAAGTLALGLLLFLRRALLPRPAASGAAGARSAAGTAAWALLAALPVATVAATWSAYQYLFAVCGLAYLAALGLARLPAPFAAAAVLVLAVSTTSAGRLREFATQSSPWTSLSHVNRRYIERSAEVVARYVRQMQLARPTLPESSVVFFANIPPGAAFQTADGPVVRWAYGDPTLRSYFRGDFSWSLVGDRPFFFFAVVGDSLEDHTGRRHLLHSLAFGFLLDEEYARAVEVLRGVLQRNPSDPAARGMMGKAELGTAAPPPDPVAAALHAARAESLLTGDSDSVEGALEALAARLLNPGSPLAWRRWSAVQLVHGKVPEAERSLGRYFQLGGEAARADSAAVAMETYLRGLRPGGALAQQGTRPR